MLSFRKEGDRGPLLVLLHWLGGSSETWTEVSRRLAARGVTCLAIDLPGFGASAGAAGDDVASMADEVAETLVHLRTKLRDPAGPWVLGGHSMGGKIAGVLARRALDGASGLDNLRGLAMVSASPPSPEPMTEKKRSSLLKTLGEAAADHKSERKHAGDFVDDNIGKLPLPQVVRDHAIDTVLQMRRAAFRGWLEHGSNEDWSDRVGTLNLPAVVFAGTEDGALGPDAQRAHLMPHLPEAHLIELASTGHLAPLERPAELAEHLTQFLASLELSLPVEVSEPGSRLNALMQGDHTSPHTLEVMQTRLGSSANWNYSPKVFTTGEFHTLRTLAEAVVPAAGFDLAAALDGEIASAATDGWRFAILPPDHAAWKQGLASLDRAAERFHGVSFLALYPDQQRALLTEAAAGRLGPGLLGRLHLVSAAEAFSAEQMKSWFEDVRSRFTRRYVGDPRTMDRLGYTGFADDLGFTHIQLGAKSLTEAPL